MSVTVFISYSWESDEHKIWVRDLSSRLRRDGIDVKLDQWETAPGDQLPEFMENAVRNSDFVLIICTSTYKQKSESRSGGVGYEGDIMTAEIYAQKNHRKFIPLHRLGSRETAIPSWLRGKYYIDFTGDRYKEGSYKELLDTLLGSREPPPSIGGVKSIKKDQLLYDRTLFQQRMNHFHAEKYFLARKFTDLLLARIKHIVEKFDKHIFLFLDSGTSIFPFFDFIGEAAIRASKSKEKWIEELTIVTNNLPGMQSLLQNKGDAIGKYSTDFPIDCRFLPGSASSTYLSVNGHETISAIENYKNTSNESIFISLLASNYIKINAGENRFPVMLVRRHEHSSIKKKLIEISDESYVVAALGKFVTYNVKELNMILGYTNTPISLNDTPYHHLKSNNANEALKVVTSCRKRNRLLYKTSRYLEEHLGVKCSSNHDDFVNSPIGETQHLLFLYDELPDNCDVELEIEIPHPSMRNKFKK